MSKFTESVVKTPPLHGWKAWLHSQARQDIARGVLGAERNVKLPRRDIGRTLASGPYNSHHLPSEALDDAFHQADRVDAPSRGRSCIVHCMLVDGITVEYHKPDGSIGAQARVLDMSGGQ